MKGEIAKVEVSNGQVSFGVKNIEEKTYISLRSLSPQVKFELDEKELALKINAEPEVFEGSLENLGFRISP